MSVQAGFADCEKYQVREISLYRMLAQDILRRSLESMVACFSGRDRDLSSGAEGAREK